MEVESKKASAKRGDRPSSTVSKEVCRPSCSRRVPVSAPCRSRPEKLKARWVVLSLWPCCGILRPGLARDEGVGSCGKPEELSAPLCAELSRCSGPRAGSALLKPAWPRRRPGSTSTPRAAVPYCKPHTASGQRAEPRGTRRSLESLSRSAGAPSSHLTWAGGRHDGSRSLAL